MARVAGHLSVEDLEAGFRSARDPTAMRHFQVIWLLARGHTIADVAAVTSFVPRWIEQLLARSNAHGPRGPWRSAPAQWRRAERAAPRASGAVARAARGAAARWRPVVQPQSGGLEGGRTRARGGVAPTRLGGPEGDRLVRAEAPPPPPRLGHAGGAGGVQKNYGGKACCLADWGDSVCSRAGGARWPDASQGRRIGNASYARCAACARRAGARCASAMRTAAPW